MSLGIYREGPDAPGLPIPRRSLGAFTAIVVVLAGLAFLLPPLLLAYAASGSGPDAWRLFKSGGLGMWLITLLDVALPCALAPLGAFALRGKRIPTGLLFGAASLPFVVALLFAVRAERQMRTLLAAIDPVDARNILAQGTSEAMSLDIYGGLVAGACAILVSVSAGAVVATIDPSAASRAIDANALAKSERRAVLASAACAALWVAATIVLSTLRHPHTGGFGLLVLPAVLLLAPLGPLAARGARILRAWHDRGEASHAFAALVVACVSAVFAVCALERTIESAAAAQGLEMIARASVVDLSRSILAEIATVRALTPFAYAAHAVLGIATFAIPLATALVVGKEPRGAVRLFSPSSGLALLLAVGLALGALGLARLRTADAEAFATSPPLPGGVTLPAVLHSYTAGPLYGGAAASLITVRADGASAIDGATGHDPDPCVPSSFADVFADRAATYGALLDAVDGVRCSSGGGAPSLPPSMFDDGEMVLRLRVRLFGRDANGAGDSGPLGVYLGSRVGRVDFVVDDFIDISEPPGGAAITVRSLPGGDILLDGVHVSVPPTPREILGYRVTRGTSTIRYVFLPDDTVEHVVQVVDVVEGFYGPFLGSSGRRTHFMSELGRKAIDPAGHHVLASLDAPRGGEVVSLRRALVRAVDAFDACGTDQRRGVTARVSVTRTPAPAATPVPDSTFGRCIAQAILHDLGGLPAKHETFTVSAIVW